MKFKKGQAKPVGSGIKKGQRIKRADSVLEFFESRGIDVLADYWASVQGLDGLERALAISKIFPYLYPKLSSIEVRQKTPAQVQLEQMSDAELTRHVKKILLGEKLNSEAETIEVGKVAEGKSSEGESDQD